MKIKPSLKIMGIYTLIAIIIGLIFFPILPNILNYPPDSINNEFQRNVDSGLSYNEQYLLIISVCFIIGISITNFKSRILDKINSENLEKYKEENAKLISKVYNLPYTIYLIQLIIPSVGVIGLYALSEGQINIGTIKIALIMLIIETLIALVSFIYCKNLIGRILIGLKFNEKYIKNFSSLKRKIFWVILPMIIVALSFTSLLGLSRIVEEKGEYMYFSNKMLLEENFNEQEYTISDISRIFSSISKLQKEDIVFVIYESGEYTTFNKSKLSDFFIKYTLKQSDLQNGRTYETYGIDTQGVVKKVTIDGENAYIGIKYDVTNNETIYYFLITILILLLINCFVLYYISKSLADDTTKVYSALNHILKNKKKTQYQHLPITSNDEMAKLVIAFNKIQDMTVEHIEQIEQDQYTMQRQAQFAILGEFAGGLAHDLNSPLGAVKIDISTLKRYMNSDRISTDDETRAILNEMLKNIDNSLTNMGNIIVGVRNQIRATGDTDNTEFILLDMIEGIKLLYRSLFMRNNCQLEVEIPSDLKIYGEKNKLERVIGNLIKNSIDAYLSNNIKGGKIKIEAKQNEVETIISISDKAGGIDNSLKDKIFKEMNTTKGNQGTGFGLYYSNTLIESSYRGKMYFETEEGVGTTFFIKLPNSKEEKE